MNALEVKQVQKLIEVVVDPAVQLLFAAAILYFVWGVFTFIRKSDDSTERTTGANHILWSTVGLFIMVSVWGIIAIVKKSIGA
jgi:hypothetical protein